MLISDSEKIDITVPAALTPDKIEFEYKLNDGPHTATFYFTADGGE